MTGVCVREKETKRVSAWVRERGRQTDTEKDRDIDI